MERTRTVDDKSPKPLWKKIGGGTLRIGKRIIKPNETFAAYPEEISPAFRNLVIPISGDASFAKATPKELTPEEVVKEEYTIQPRGGSKIWFDVVDASGKVLNEKALKKDMAEQLKADLER